jgi:hypothetical protein
MNHTEPYNLGWFYGDEAKETIWFHKEKNGGSYMESVFWERLDSRMNQACPKRKVGQ